MTGAHNTLIGLQQIRALDAKLTGKMTKEEKNVLIIPTTTITPG